MSSGAGPGCLLALGIVVLVPRDQDPEAVLAEDHFFAGEAFYVVVCNAINEDDIIFDGKVAAAGKSVCLVDGDGAVCDDQIIEGLDGSGGYGAAGRCGLNCVEVPGADEVAGRGIFYLAVAGTEAEQKGCGRKDVENLFHNQCWIAINLIYLSTVSHQTGSPGYW